jgi:CDP-glucose 4,6-dehydratase
MHPGYKRISKFFKGKKILITGNTGFKGSWLTVFLNKFDCELYGYSDRIITKPSLYRTLKLDNKIKTFFKNIKNKNDLNEVIKKIQPDIIFHLAAQSLVPESIKKPKETLLINTVGTLNLLECLREYKKKIACIIVTSDKCYYPLKNKSYFSEIDMLGGEDPYSASKACAEIIYKCYYETYFNNLKKILSCTVRAGNVVGGGDWSKNRIIPDIFNSIENKKNVILRNPNSNRPWQHVFEPIWAYILLSEKLYCGKFDGASFNVGPNLKNNEKVIHITEKIIKGMNSKIQINKKKSKFKETNKLNLNTQKINKKLGWSKILNNEMTFKLIIDWYKIYKLKNKNKLYEFSENQVDFFINSYFRKK